MIIVTYTEARQNLSSLLDKAKKEEILIKRRDGSRYRLIYETQKPENLFDIPGIRTKATTKDILAAIREGRERT